MSFGKDILYFAVRSRGFLRDGSGLSGFQSPVHAASVECVLRNSCQMWDERAQSVLDECRSKSRLICCDQYIVFDGFYISQDYPEQLRRIHLKDPETGKTMSGFQNNAVQLPN